MNRVITLLLENIDYFGIFSKVYIFGSVLKLDDVNDIDLLLVYKSYSERLNVEINIISSHLEDLIQIPIDLTVLSEKELDETKFLEKLDIYKRLK